MSISDLRTASARMWTESERSVIVAVFVLLAVASLLPALLTPIPAMVDYPNHLARMYILSRNGTADANPYYEATWAIYPNLAMDLIVPQIGRLIGVETAARLFLLLSQLLIISGAALLERIVKGRIYFAGFVALMFLYCLPFAWGFINFEFGLGAMLWAISAYMLAVERGFSARFTVNAVFFTILFLAHFFALGIYGATIGIYEIWRSYERKLPHRDTLMRLVILAIPLLVLIYIMKNSSGSIGGEGTEWWFALKPLWLFRIMNGYSPSVSSASAFLLIALLYYAISRKVMKLDSAGIWLAIGFAVLYLIIPSKLRDTAFVDLRVIPAAALILPAFCSLTLPSRRWTMIALAAIGSITLANLAVVLAVWFSYRADYASMIQSFSKIDRGSLILIGDSGDGEDPPFRDLTRYPMVYAPTLAVEYAGAFVPNLFTEQGKQPVRARAAVRRLAIPYGGPVPIRVLSAIATGQILPDAPPFIRNWRRDYDYLYLLGPRIVNPLPGLLEELGGSERFVLYRIRPTAQFPNELRRKADRDGN